MSEERSCRILKSNVTENISGWEGIPEAVALNASMATALLIVLAVIRIIYFRRKPYQNNWNIDWLQFIYSDRKADVLHYENRINRLHPNAYLPPCLQSYTDLIQNKLNDSSMSSSLYVTSNIGDKMKEKHQAKLDSIGKTRHWLLDYILIKDKYIYEHRGNDAFQYLLFQRYIIYYLTALTAVCIIILMPINIYGKNGEKGYFEMTTINNINEKSNIFWIHTIIAISVVILGILMMKNFSDLIFAPAKESDDRTILVQNIPESKRNALLLKTFIEKKFIGVEVTRITFTYDIETLKSLTKQLAAIKSALVYCEKYKLEYGYPLEVSPYFGSRICSICPKVDGIRYYKHQYKEYQIIIRDEVSRTLSDPKHAVFIQLKNELMAQRILEHFDNTQHERFLKRIFKYIKNCFIFGRHSDLDSFGYNTWVTKAAPFPEDIEWKDIVMNNNTSGICSLLLNFLIIVIFLFLTTPLVAMNFLEEISVKIGINIKEIQDNVDGFRIGSLRITLAKYFSAMMMNLITAILPNLIVLIELYVPRATKSEKNHKVMKMVYLYLVLMVMIFPSLGLMSGQLLIKKLFDKSDKSLPNYFYKCLFPAGSSSFFVHYVISCIFFNNSLQLLRIPELGMYIINCIIYPRTVAEYEKARMETNFNFSYGTNYPRFLLIFTIVTTYSIACPIIAPFGLLYMLFKHLVDRYSIYYLYSTPVISPNIHQTAISFVLISYFFLLLQLTAFLNTRNEFSLQFKPSNVCTIALLLYVIFLSFTCSNFNNLYRKDSTFIRYNRGGRKKKSSSSKNDEQ